MTKHSAEYSPVRWWAGTVSTLLSYAAAITAVVTTWTGISSASGCAGIGIYLMALVTCIVLSFAGLVLALIAKRIYGARILFSTIAFWGNLSILFGGVAMLVRFYCGFWFA